MAMKFQPSCVQLGWLAVIFGGLSVLVAEAQALEKAKLRVKFHAIQFSEHGDAEEETKDHIFMHWTGQGIL